MMTNFEEQLFKLFKGKNILITGATGTMGRALAKRILSYHPNIVRLFSRDEHKQYVLKQEIGHIPQYRFLLGDVRDLERVSRAMEGIDIVVHTAALKHLPACEYNPFEAIKTNVIGTQNVIQACLHHGVHKMIVTSSDKAAAPENTLGATKLLAERLVSSMAYAKGTSPTIFCGVRFGNVLGSRGSAINQFIDNLRKERPIKVTDMNMTRFMMSIEQAVNIVLKALVLSQGGDIFIFKMPVVRLGDLVHVLLREFTNISEDFTDISGEANMLMRYIELIGVRPGEKMYEELLTEEESKNALEWDDMFVLPSWFQYGSNYPDAKPVSKGVYSSRGIQPITEQEIKSLLLQSNLLEESDK